MKKLCLSLLFLSVCLIISNDGSIRTERTIAAAAKAAKEAEWERMVEAICWVESRNNDQAKSEKSSAAGRFQMLRIYVVEVNRILGEKRYSESDRHNPKKAREMFDIYQAHHNPNKDIDRAIRIHRGLYSPKYIKSVKKRMYETTNIRTI